MNRNSLEVFMRGVQADWGPLTSELLGKCAAIWSACRVRRCFIASPSAISKRHGERHRIARYVEINGCWMTP